MLVFSLVFLLLSLLFLLLLVVLIHFQSQNVVILILLISLLLHAFFHFAADQFAIFFLRSRAVLIEFLTIHYVALFSVVQFPAVDLVLVAVVFVFQSIIQKHRVN